MLFSLFLLYGAIIKNYFILLFLFFLIAKKYFLSYNIFMSFENNFGESTNRNEILEGIIPVIDLNEVWGGGRMDIEDEKKVIRKKEGWIQKKERDILEGKISKEGLEQIQKGIEMEEKVLDFFSRNEILGKIKKFYKTTDYDDYFNHTDVIAELEDDDFFGFTFDVTYTGSENFHGLNSKLSWTKRNIEEGHLTNIKYGPKGVIEDIPRVVLSLGDSDKKILNGGSERDKFELSMYMLAQIREQVEKFEFFTWNQIDTLEEKGLGKGDDEWEKKQKIISIYEDFIDNLSKLEKEQEEKFNTFLISEYQKKFGNSIHISKGKRYTEEIYIKDEKDKIKNIIFGKIDENGNRITNGKMVDLRMSLAHTFGCSGIEEEELNNYLSERPDKGNANR